MSEQDSNGRGDLWGAAFVVDPIESAPIALLREQAEALTERTGGRLEGVVLVDADKRHVWASLCVKAPSLQDYTYKLLSVAHSLAADPDNPATLSVHDTFGEERDPIEIEGMEEFRRWLEVVLSSGSARAVVINLLRYSPSRAAS